MNLNPTQTALAVNIMAMLGLPASEAFTIHQPDANFESGRVLAANASTFSGNNPHEFLSNYAVRYQDPLQDTLGSLREIIAPEVPSNNSAFVEYAVYGFADAFLAMDNGLDVRRAPGADYATLRNPVKSMATQRLPDVGLAVEVDEDEELLDTDWQQRKVAHLLGIIERSELRTAIALMVAGATNVNKTWDTSAGKDPDMDVITEIDAMVIKPNHIIYGPGAATKRMLSLRAQNLAGQANSSTLTMDQLGGMLNAQVRVPQHRYATGAATTASVMGSVVMMFSSTPGMSRNDFSNLKTFVAPVKGMGKRAVWVRQVGDKRWRIAVSTGKRLVALTSAIGLETITVN